MEPLQIDGFTWYEATLFHVEKWGGSAAVCEEVLRTSPKFYPQVRTETRHANYQIVGPDLAGNFWTISFNYESGMNQDARSPSVATQAGPLKFGGTTRMNEMDGLTRHEKDLLAAVEEIERHMDDEPGARVEAKVSKSPRQVFSLKIGASELDELSRAAKEAGESLGAYIRSAALGRAREKQLVERVRELAEAAGFSVNRP